MDLNRRGLLISGAALATLGAVTRPAGALLLTPPQTSGPFYPLTLPLDGDNDLVHVAGRSEGAAGMILHLGGRVLDRDGRPVPGARIEVWQCDAFGVYHHPRDPRGPADPNFQGFGATTAAADGGYRFRTIEPVPYPGRTPHIHFTLTGPGFERLTTQMYLAGHPLNEGDGLYQRIADPAARAAVTVALLPAPELEPRTGQPAKRATFDIVLGLIT
jgi:protocatechuate 3,4-dioxygenase beta subunit